VRKADNLPPSCAVVMKSGSLNFLEPSRPVQTCNGTDLPLLVIIVPLMLRTHLHPQVATWINGRSQRTFEEAVIFRISEKKNFHLTVTGLRSLNSLLENKFLRILRHLNELLFVMIFAELNYISNIGMDIRIMDKVL
jgi:hypothetical protein